MQVIIPNREYMEKTHTAHDFNVLFEEYIVPIVKKLLSVLNVSQELQGKIEKHVYSESRQEWEDLKKEEQQYIVFEELINSLYYWIEEVLREENLISSEYPDLKQIAEALEVPFRQIMYYTYGFETGDPVGIEEIRREYDREFSVEQILEAYREFFIKAKASQNTS